MAGLAVVLSVTVAIVVFTTTPASITPLSITTRQPVPSRAPSGYQLVVAEKFTGTSVPSAWHPYQGQAGSDTGGWWDPSHVTVGNGALTLRTYKDPAHAGPRSPWVEGGIDLWPSGVLTDGEYLVRSRVTSATGVTEVMLLWPNSDNWPPEIDFNESNGTNESTAHLIYGSASQPQTTQSVTLTPATVNLTQWHTWGVIVTPTTITYTVDGKTWATMANHEQVPMHLALQQQVWACNNTAGRACPSAATPSEVDMQIDWVVVLAPGHRHRR
jgi:beta-glucanase (GH16 family)